MSMTEPAAPLTAGTAGHVDHGKTALVRALTGVETDRLPEERRRGLTIALGYASLPLDAGRTLSLIDVPGHERLVRVMVSGATGIDLFLLVVAADDGPMPQTLEHLHVLRALGVGRGVVAITKSDRADPEPAIAAVRRLVPDVEPVACSAHSGAGLDAVATALRRVAAELPSRAARTGEPVLHIDRVFTIRGAGTVVTGTLWSGAIATDDQLRLLPGDRVVRVRGVQVHDVAASRAAAGQRVAVNLARIDRASVRRGDVLAGAGAALTVSRHLEIEPDDEGAAGLTPGQRLQLHHGTRDVAARVRTPVDGRWPMRLEQPLIVARGDRVVLRRISPPDTLGGGEVIATSRRHPPGASARPRAAASPSAPSLGAVERALEARLRSAGHEPLDAQELGDPAALRGLRAAGRAVRVGRSMYTHPEVIDRVRVLVEARVERDGEITLAGLRDELSTSRKFAQALLEHLDATRVTRRLPDDRRVLRGHR